MEDFSSNVLVVAVIKELLKDVNLPSVPVLTDDTRLYDGRTYIYKGSVVKCEGTDLYELYPYNFNDRILNMTRNLKIKSGSYDDKTHVFLGNFLRYLRDYKNLNLMKMYNCFNKVNPVRLEKTLTSGGRKIVLDTYDSNYRYYIVPVKLDKSYTIAFDSPAEFEMCCIMYDEFLVDNDLNDQLMLDSHQVFGGSRFNKPFLYSTSFKSNNRLWKYEDSIKLVLKVPVIATSSIVILEGDYRSEADTIDGRLTSTCIVNDGSLNSFSKNWLLETNDTLHHSFSPRLVEYLCGHVVSNLSDNDLDIKKIQDMLYKNDGIAGSYGLWHNDISHRLQMLYDQSDLTGDKNSSFRNSHYDLLGHLDKDTESLLEAKERASNA